MLQFAFWKKIDYLFLIFLSILMLFSLLVISSITQEHMGEKIFFTSHVQSQLKWFVLGWAGFFLSSAFNYHRLREWTWGLYLLSVLGLIGLYFTSPIQNVHRWYRIPLLRITFQPSEYTKLITVLAMSWYVERQGALMQTLGKTCKLCLIFFVPFFLILKQPDLGSALVLFPIFLVILEKAKAHPFIRRVFYAVALACCLVVGSIFSGIVDHSKAKVWVTKFMKGYQYERLNPDSYHQRAAKTAIAIGGVWGQGWREGEFAAQKWVPAAHTDSIFCGLAEEFGLWGILLILGVYFFLIDRGLKIHEETKDSYGKCLALGLTLYFAMHVMMNIGMMAGMIPLSGVPLLLLTYGGNSVLTTMIALGILQSIKAKRNML